MFLEKSIEKKLNLLYFIDLFGPEIYTTDIMAYLNISQNTLKKYIKEINFSINDYELYYVDNNVIAPLNQKKTGSLVGSEILEESINLKIIYEIFRYQLSLIDLSNKLFLSKSTITKKIQSINEYFKQKGLLIKIENNKSYTIVGNEKEIRFFFQILFTEANNQRLFKKNEVIFKEVHSFINRYFPNNHSFYQEISNDSYLYVSIIRTAQGHFIYPSLEFLTNTVKNEVDKTYNYFIEKTPFISFIEREYRCRYTPLFTANTINWKLLEVTSVFGKIEEKNKDTTNKILLLIEEYCKEYTISMDRKEVDLFVLFLCKKIHLTGKFNQVLLKDFEVHFYYLKEISPGHIEFILKKVIQLNLLSNRELSVVYEFIIYFILNNKKIRLNFFGVKDTFIESKKLLIYSSKQASIGKMIGHTIKDKYDDKLVLQIDYMDTLYESLHKDDYDLIISDRYLDIFEDKYMYLSMIPTDIFWEEFENKIFYN